MVGSRRGRHVRAQDGRLRCDVGGGAGAVEASARWGRVGDGATCPTRPDVRQGRLTLPGGRDERRWRAGAVEAGWCLRNLPYALTA